MRNGHPEQWEKVLPVKLMEAVRDPEKWGDVLDLIMLMSGAKGAIITLRDRQNCQIVNDIELETKYHSPLIRGFTTDQIVYYLTNLRTADPWAEFQKTYYPHRPLQMSKVCPRDSVEDTRFFDWLDDIGFEDTVVFELDRVAGYWTAINLFLEKPDTPDARRAMTFAQEYCDLLRGAWVSSQALAQSRQSSGALLERAAGAGAPICIVGANGELLDSNELFDELLDEGSIRVSGPDKRLSFANSVTLVGLKRWEQTALVRHNSRAPAVTLLASRLDPDPIFAGKRESHWILTSGAKSGSGTVPATYLDLLTRQERGLYDGIVAGKSVEDAGKAVQLKRSRSFEVWSAVKDKLGIKSAHQLRQ